MTTNAPSVKNYKAVDDVMNGAPKNGAAVEMRKRKESLAKRQQSFIRQDSCGVVLERPLTRYIMMEQSSELYSPGQRAL